MAHLIYFLNGKSFNDTQIKGVLEEIETNMDRRKYPLNDIREGYNIPTQSKWVLYDNRIKKEVIPYLARDLRPINLNPTNNKTTIFDILKGKDSKNRVDTVGRSFLAVRWAFKWINRKKTTSAILFIIGTLTLQIWLYIVILAILINPLKPVPIADGEPQRFTRDWYYCILLGVLNDTYELQDDTTGERQEDIL